MVGQLALTKNDPTQPQTPNPSRLGSTYWGRLPGPGMAAAAADAWSRWVGHYLTRLIASEADSSSLTTDKIWKNGASTNVSIWISAKFPGEFINTEVYGIGSAFKRYKK